MALLWNMVGTAANNFLDAAAPQFYDNVGRRMWKYGSTYYMLAVDQSVATPTLSMWKSTNPIANGWTRVDTSNSPPASSGGEIAGLDSELSGSSIHIVYTFAGTSESYTRYAEFDCSTDTWQQVDGSNYFYVISSVTGGGTDVSDDDFAHINVRSDGDVLVFYNGEQTASKGNDYNRIYYARLESSTWTVDIPVGEDTNHNEAVLGMVTASDDDTWLLYLDPPGGSPVYRYRKLTGANSLDSSGTTSSWTGNEVSFKVPIVGYATGEGAILGSFNIADGYFIIAEYTDSGETVYSSSGVTYMDPSLGNIGAAYDSVADDLKLLYNDEGTSNLRRGNYDFAGTFADDEIVAAAGSTLDGTSADVSGEIGTTDVGGVCFSDDDTKMYVADVDGYVYQYSITDGDPDSASYDSKSLDCTSQTTAIQAIWMGDSNTKIYVMSTAGTIYQYDLSTAKDVGSGSYSTYSFDASFYGGPGFALSPNGTILKVLRVSSPAIGTYTLSTPWRISTAASGSTTTFGSVTTPAAYTVSKCGRYAAVHDSNNNTITQFYNNGGWVGTGTYTAVGNKSLGASAVALGYTGDGRYLWAGRSTVAAVRMITCNLPYQLDGAAFMESSGSGGHASLMIDGSVWRWAQHANSYGPIYYFEYETASGTDLAAAFAASAAGTAAGTGFSTFTPTFAGIATGDATALGYSIFAPAFAGAGAGAGAGWGGHHLTTAMDGIATGDATGKALVNLVTAMAGSAAGAAAGQAYQTLVAAMTGQATGDAAGTAYELLTAAFAGIATNTGEGTSGTDLIIALTAAAAGSASGLGLETLSAAFTAAANNAGSGWGGHLLTSAFTGSGSGTGAGTAYELLTAAFAGSGAGTGTGQAFATLVLALTGAATGTGAGAAYRVLAAAFDGIASNTGSGSAGGASDLIVALASIATGSGTGQAYSVLSPAFVGSANGAGSATGFSTLIVDLQGAAAGTAAGQAFATLAATFAGAANTTGAGQAYATLSAAFNGSAAGSGSGIAYVLLSAAFAATATGTGDGWGGRLLTAAFSGAASGTASGQAYAALVSLFAGIADGTGTGSASGTELAIALAGAASASGAGTAYSTIISAYFQGAAQGWAKRYDLVPWFKGFAEGSGEATHAQPLLVDMLGNAINSADGIGPSILIPQFDGIAAGSAAATAYRTLMADFLGIADNDGEFESLLVAEFLGEARAWGVGREREIYIDFLAKALQSTFNANGLIRDFMSNDLKGN